jgi:WD40 repeat protein
MPVVVGLLILVLHKPAPDFPLRIWSASLSPDGKVLATAGGQTSADDLPRLGELIFWDIASGKKKKIVKQGSTIRSVTWAPDGKFVAIGDFGGGAKLVQPMTGKLMATLPPHSGGVGGGVNAVAISGDSMLVAAGSADGTVTLWDMAGKELDPLMLPPTEKAINVAVSPNHAAVAVGGRLGKAYLYSVTDRSEPRILQAYGGRPTRAEPRVEAIAFSPDGLQLATGCETTLRLWETDSGKLVRDLRGATARINSLAFARDSQSMATVDDGGTLMLWNMETGEIINTATAHKNASFSVSFSQDGKRIATAGLGDFSAKIWDAPSLLLRATLYRKKPNQT